MLTSNRFTSVLSETTKARLAKVFDNSKPMTRRESCQGAVVAIQAALSDLNQGYLASAEVDGIFGSKTAQAVEAFQRDYGLFVDGVVGRQVLTELDTIYSGNLFRAPRGMSIHVGVNVVDAAHYGSPYPLSACVNDATAFQTLASSLGYEDVLLTNEAATTSNFTSALRYAATSLFSGDYLFVSFSGHGSQLVNTSPDDESDGLDETLCFYDRMMLDDEVYSLLSEMRPGVNVTLLYDSCHSGTVTRAFMGGATASSSEMAEAKNRMLEAMVRRVSAFDPEQPEHVGIDDASNQRRFMPFQRDELSKALDGESARQVTREAISRAAVAAIADAVVETARELGTAAGRFIGQREANGPSGVYERNRAVYDAVKNVVGSHGNLDLECHVVAFSACQDNQTTLDGSVHGLYTSNVLGAWNGGFAGSILQLHDRLVAESPSTITPSVHTYGGPRAAGRVHDRPFAF